LSVVIRLSRQGHRHLPFYRIAVADQRKAATGKFLQHIGYYDPAANPPSLKVDEASALKWLQVGAQPSDTVRSLFQHQGIMDKFAKTRQGKATPETAGKVVDWKVRKPKIHKKQKEVLAKEAADAAKAAETAKVAAAADAAKAAEAAKVAAEATAAADAATAAEAAAAEAAGAEAAPAT
jgi:small subunit ribosomal protein S16